MKADFKQIRKTVKKGRSIDAELVRSSCSDALLMTTYSGKGDEYYAIGSITALKPVFGLGLLGGYYIPISTLVFMPGVVTLTEFEIEPAQN